MPDATNPFENKPILAALDLSERSTDCLRYGCEMASKFGQPLILAHVVHETAETTGMYRRYHKGSDTTPLIDIARVMLEDSVARFREACDALDQVEQVRLVVVPGVPDTRIVELAESCDAGVILLCSQNRRGMNRWLQASVAESVMRHTERPVVVLGGEGRAPSPFDIHRPLQRTAAASTSG